jgi:NADH:ubiquinone oxidoreductase subunit F (NADH-binding)
MTSTLERARVGSRAPSVQPPTDLPRLLAGWYEQRRPAALGDHLDRYGALPLARPDRADELVELIEAAGLTGRGGAGFPTHRKLRAVREPRRRPIVVANGVEGEPASAKDRLLLSVAPHLVLDGAVLAAAAVGADEVHVCVPRGARSSLQSLERALAERERDRIDPVRIRAHTLPARYVAGEETSVVNWLNGGPAKPTATPPRPFERGVRGRPTLIQNVETLAHVALIARFGAAWFRGVGTADAPGSLLVSVSGAVSRPAVLEVPQGTTIGRVVAAFGLEQAPQAVLVGGYFGAWHPWHEATSLPLTQADLRSAGGALGAGIVAVLPPDACGLCETTRIAAYLAGQSARQCGPCQHGLPAIARDLAQVCHGSDPEARERAMRRMRQIEGRGACRHPDGAVRLVRSALRAFSEHVEWHERYGRCAGMQRTPLLPGPSRSSAEEPWR